MKKSVLGSLLVAAASEYANNLKQEVKDAGKSLLDELQDSIKRDKKYYALLDELAQLEDTRKRWVANGMSLTSNTIKLVDQAITDLRKAIQDYLDEANRETLREAMRTVNEGIKPTAKSPNMSKEEYDEQELKSRVDFDSSANFEPTKSKVLDPRLGALRAVITYHYLGVVRPASVLLPMESIHVSSNIERVIAMTREEDDCRLLESAYLDAKRGVARVEYVNTLEEIYNRTDAILNSVPTASATIDSITVSQLINHLDTEGNELLVRHIMRAVARM
ncbi:putative coil containing protein [Vibrio phage 150E35-1]|nr:putative coil containing protein [Vibrio phage 150E35-1]